MMKKLYWFANNHKVQMMYFVIAITLIIKSFFPHFDLLFLMVFILWVVLVGGILNLIASLERFSG